MLNVRYSEMWSMMNTLLTWYSEVHALVQEEFLPASVFRAWESGERCSQKECIRTTSKAFSILNLRTCVAGWICAVGTRNSHLWGRDNPHGTIESNYQHRFSVNVWCGVIGDQIIGPYIFPQRLTGAIYANFLRDELPALLENVPLQTRLQMYYQHDGAPPHFSQVVRQYLDHKFPNRWIGRGGTQNWPPWSPDLNPLDYHVWGYMKAMVYEQKVNTREELVHRILSAARSINNAAVLRKVTSSLVTRVRKCMEADGGYFENLWTFYTVKCVFLCIVIP